ncbi:unnamed protein product [Meloidogyne enterolobii]|uniref:Uncharacterized protein n=1 Tax=Meloidogyne enterolobii TaxID=390850 RepID=A0ACB0Z1D2_MELEN
MVYASYTLFAYAKNYKRPEILSLDTCASLLHKHALFLHTKQENLANNKFLIKRYLKFFPYLRNKFIFLFYRQDFYQDSFLSFPAT